MLSLCASLAEAVVNSSEKVLYMCCGANRREQLPKLRARLAQFGLTDLVYIVQRDHPSNGYR